MLRCLRALATLMAMPAVAIIVAVLARRREHRPCEESILWIDAQPGTPSAGEEPPHAAPPLPAKPDDLTRIEGIGPKSSALLQAAGISTYAKLASADISRLRSILTDGGIRAGSPATWPEQAQLAATEDWQALEALQGQLKGGRRA